MAYFYPVFLKVAHRRCVVIGGGPAAHSKALGLLEASARVTVVSPDLTPALQELAAEGRLTWIPRAYRPGDLEGAFVAIAAGEDQALNALLWEEAERRGVLLNAVDDLAHCHFVAPAVYRQGHLGVAVGTDGKSPALATWARDRIAEVLGPEHGRLAELLGELRESVAARLPDPKARRRLWRRIVASEVAQLLRQGDLDGARRRIEAMIQEAAGPASPA